jgi:hypothetical protein
MSNKFKPHMMYKGKKSVKANTMKDHLRLAKQGYGHEDPYKKNDNKPKFEFGGKMISADSARKKLKSAREKNGYKTFKGGGKVEGGFEGYEKIASSKNSNVLMAKKAEHHGKHTNAEYKFTKDKEGNTHMYAKFDKGGKAKSKVNEAGNYTKPAMRKRLFERIKAGTKGGRAGQWSARKAQLLASLYKKNGGGYTN